VERGYCASNRTLACDGRDFSARRALIRPSVVCYESAVRVHRSNRVERLLAALVEVVTDPLPDPFARECIVVQGRGMERWLSMRLAQHLGVWANPDFPFPRRAVERVLAAMLGEEPDTGAFAPETLTWAIAAELPRRLRHPAFGEIRRYLDDDRDGRMRLQLAARLADLLDQYAVFRPEMVLEWEAGRDADWQAELWRALRRRLGGGHLAARAHACLRAFAAGDPPQAPLPARLLLFGVSTLPPLFVRLFAALSRHVEVHLFLLSPSPEYIGDYDAVRARRRRRARPGAAAQLDLFSDDEPDEGPPLLYSLGRLGSQFQEVLLDSEASAGPEDDRFDPPDTSTMLGALQSELLTLAPAPELCVSPNDDSITVHACHSPMREVEVLHDQLLGLFDRDPTLSPDDVVVMAPFIDAYAPFVDAVFGAGDRPRIPFRIADRNPRRVSEVYEAFAAVLDLLPGRHPASAVLDLLQHVLVAERFALSGEDLDRIGVWVAESGIRWGVDASHRRAIGQPVSEANTWRFGLDRLLLGYALPGEGRLRFGEVLPYDDVEGSDTAALGKLADLCDALSVSRERLRTARTPAEWRDELIALLATFVHATPYNAHQHQAVVAALAALAERAALAGFDESLELAALRPQLERELELRGSTRGFLAGGVTFCELVPMRTIPFRVVCLIGLADGSFPRSRRPLGFDRVAQRPRPGDRSARDDDRYLFLEALLSARDRVLITYVGQSIADNSELPPSVIVRELLDSLARHQAAVERREPGAAVPAPIIIRHPLQPFSRAYFTSGSQLFSYASGHHRGAQALAGTRRDPAPFVSAPLAPEPEASVDVDALVRFFDNPARGFLQRSLRLVLGADRRPPEDREPQAIDALDRWRVGDALLGRAVRGDDLADVTDLLRATGTLPLGAAGDCAVAAAMPVADALSRTAAERRAGARLDPLLIDSVIGSIRLTGTLRERWPGGQIYVQYSQPSPKHQLRLWIRHLILNACGDAGCSSLLLARGKNGGVAEVRLAPYAGAAELLARLVELYRIGGLVPVPLLTNASCRYAIALAKGQDRARAELEAEKAYFRDRDEGGPFDQDDEYTSQVYGETPPFHPRFVPLPGAPSFDDVARVLWGPLLAHRLEL
jgi:exodeoxyribonuclease V gamma subunit